MYDLFGKYGAIRQMRMGNKPETKGTVSLTRICSYIALPSRTLQAYVVYEDIFDAKNACEHLSGFNVMGRYLTVVYHQAHKVRMLTPRLQLHSWRRVAATKA